MTCIETSRLFLRLFTQNDLDAISNIYTDPEVMKYIHTGEALSKEESQKKLNSQIMHWENHGFGFWAVVYKENNELIGCGGLKVSEDISEIEVGYLLAKPYWGRGLATEITLASVEYGFTHLSLNKIIAVVQYANIPSQKVLEKAGLKYEKDIFLDNKIVKYYTINREKFSDSRDPKS